MFGYLEPSTLTQSDDFCAIIWLFQQKKVISTVFGSGMPKIDVFCGGLSERKSQKIVDVFYD